MKTYFNDKYLTDENLKHLYYDHQDGVIRKKGTGELMRSKTASGRPVISIKGKLIAQNRIVCKLNGVRFTPTCEIEHINGDFCDLRIDNLTVKLFEFEMYSNQNVKFSASNDRYLPEVSQLYSYDPLTGVVTNKSTGEEITSCHNGYPVIQYRVNGKCFKIKIHRFAMWTCGFNIEGKQIDHLNGVRHDNRLCNLRVVESFLNRRNSAKQRNNTSGIAGVSWHKKNCCWEVRVNRKNIGYSKDFFEACCIRKSHENKVGDFTERHGR